MARRPVDPQQSFPELEEQVLARWRERDVFHESVRRREGAEPWVFWEGPPTANGKPGVHHVLARVFKDIYPRYKTMRGYQVERKGGWDTHGLPVEIAVQQQLGIENKQEIEEFGIAEFNQRCREAVFEYLEDWNALTERIGFWIDLDDAYRTLDPTYIESVWWALRQIHDKGLLYEGHKVVPYCPGCGRRSPATRSRSATRTSSIRASTCACRWSRTAARCRPATSCSCGPPRRGPSSPTPRSRSTPSSSTCGPRPARSMRRSSWPRRWSSASSAPKACGSSSASPAPRSTACATSRPSPISSPTSTASAATRVLLGDFVTADDGTGLVHTAIAFGEEDFRLGQQYGLNVVNPVRPDGTYDERIGPYVGRKVKDADPDLIEDLRARGRLLRAETIEHAYPHCWRSGDPLIYYAKRSWYIATSKLRDRLIEANGQVDWHPEHIREGRMGDWLRGNVDWALSRERYWGTPLPVWRCTSNSEHTHVIGSLDELEELSGVRLEDPHRPFVDEVGFPCPHCGARMERVPEVIDVWFDSGSMPFAQYHAPFENLERFQARSYANFVCEALDQTRGWFYSLLAISVLLFDRSPYETVVCLGLILDGDGQKMSKSKGNIVAPTEVIDRFGADAVRWYFFTAKNPWDGYRFNLETIGESIRLFLRQLWNTYAFLTTYEAEREGEATELDRWILSRLSATVEAVTERMDAFDTTTAGRAIAEFVDDLSNWYVRGSRRRFWEGDGAAFATLETALLTVAKLVAPFTPFIADELYDNLDGTEPSVHLTDWPEADPARTRDIGLEHAMTVARETVRLGLSARAAAKIKLRQPLKEAVVVAVGREREGIERLADIVRDQLNVKELRFVQAADELGSYDVKPNYRALGPRFGKRMPQVAAAVAALDPAHVAEALRDGRSIGVAVDGHDHQLSGDDLVLAMAPLDGYQLEREGSHAVALELAFDDDLRREGLAREVVHAVQNARKAAGLAVEDRIRLVLGGDDELLGAAQAHEEYLVREVLAVEIAYDGSLDGHAATIEDRELRIGVARA